VVILGAYKGYGAFPWVLPDTSDPLYVRGYISEVCVLCGPLSIEVLDLNPTLFTVQLEVACEHVDKGTLVIVLRHSPVFDLFIRLSLQSDVIAA
jgi:hypothetical protein